MRAKLRDLLLIILTGSLLLLGNAEGVARAVRFTAPKPVSGIATRLSNSLADVSRALRFTSARQAGEYVADELDIENRVDVAPNGVLFLGDSVLDDIVESFTEMVGSQLPVSKVIMKGSQLGSPLWDWDKLASEAAERTRADTAVVMLDTTGVGERHYVEYESLVRVLYESGVKQVLLLGRPVSADDTYEADRGTRIKQMRAACASTGAVCADLSSALMGTNGSFPAFVTGLDGRKIKVRENDGYHLTRAGSEMFASDLLSLLGVERNDLRK